MVSEAIEAVAGVIRRTPARRDLLSFKLHELTSVVETYEMQRLAIRARCLSTIGLNADSHPSGNSRATAAGGVFC
jgi:hypothetical protein